MPPYVEKNALYHAYAMEYDDVSLKKLLLFFKDDLSISVVGNPDFFHQKFELFGIDDSRRIKEIYAMKALSVDMPRIFLIEFHGATREAQNALLKMIEEPKSGNHFFLVLPSFDILLPTVKSRLRFIRSTDMYKNVDRLTSEDVSARDFMEVSLKDKMAFVDKIATDVSDGKMTKRDVFVFINNLEDCMYRREKMNKDVAGGIISRTDCFEAIARARDYMNDRAPSVKMLLEYVALTV